MVSHRVSWPILVAALSSPVFFANCGTAKDLQEAASGCDEFQQGADAVGRAQIDANVKAFVQASAEFKSISARIKTEVKTACVDVCSRLQIADTWSSFGDDDSSISNAQGTGACDKAAVEIDAIMKESKATAHFALLVTEPKCTVDTDVQASCEATCKVDAVCKPGEVDVVTRCEPGKLSVQCDGTCNANAFCEGTAEVAVQCQGSCDATCQGQCMGTCIAETGTTSENDAACKGKCKGTCMGSCDGDCQVTAASGIMCGANASCRGGCTGTATAPKCETELKALPPECHADANCEVGCSARARSNVHCTEPKVVLAVDVNVSTRVAALKGAIEANFPKLVLAAQTEGPIVLKALQDMSASGAAVASGAASLGGKSVACVGTAVQAAASASATVNVSVNASTKVHSSCSSNEG